MKNSYHRNRHQRKKSIKEAERAGYAQEEKAGWNESEKARYFTSDKKLKIDKGKADPSKKHYQTSPKDTSWQTEPDSIHKEGKKWLSTTNKKMQSQAKRLKAKMDKYYSKGKKSR